MSADLYGILAQFHTPQALLNAAQALRDDESVLIEAYTPYPVEGLTDALGVRRNIVPAATLIGGVLGGIGGYVMQWYAAVISYPINIGGRPLHSWPLFVPVSFEMTILCAALAAVFSMVLANGLPRLNHPLFEVPSFSLATRDRYFICVRSRNGELNTAQISGQLKELGAQSVIEVAQ